MTPVFSSTLLALLAASSLVFGSFLTTWADARARWLRGHLSQLIGFSAGLMLATALHELIPAAVASNHDHGMWGAGAGFLTLYIAERLTHFHACRHRDCDLGEPETAPAVAAHAAAHTHDDCSHSHHHHAHEESHGHSHGHQHGHAHAPVTTSGHADLTALAGMSIHNFADGLTTAAAFAVSQTVGVVAVIAIVLHQLAAGASLGAIMLRARRAPRRVWISTALSASFIVWGALFYNFAVPVGSGITGIILGIAGGSFLYVAACDLLPEAHDGDEGWNIMATTLAGYIFALVIITSFGHAH
ncbi:MAG TPA: ZIP family metal transporter [Abditibacteriaceae bacterium]